MYFRSESSKRISASDAGTPAGGPAGGTAEATGVQGNEAASLPPRSVLAQFTARSLGAGPTPPPRTDALNAQVVQAVQFSNSETAAYAPTQIAVAPNMMITQASGLVAQSAAAYFDGVSKVALASQGVLIQQMTQRIAAGDALGAGADALGALLTDVLVGAAAAVAAAAGALEAESASFAIDRIDKSVSTYFSLLQNAQGSGGGA